jgi:S-adenosylmethionine decarboxylase
MSDQKRRRHRLSGFNNLTKSLSFNLYDFVAAFTEEERASYQRWIDVNYSAARITELLTQIAEIIDAQVLSVSQQDYDPNGASALVLIADESVEKAHGGKQAPRQAVAAHLDKSHLCAHTYPDLTDPGGACSVRLDVSVSTCGEVVPLRALDHLLRAFSNDVVIIDYTVRGFVRDERSQRLFMDHSLRSIRDYISPEILDRYVCEELALQNEKIWQTKLLKTTFDPVDFFVRGVDVTTEERKTAFEHVKREMAGVFHGSPT